MTSQSRRSSNPLATMLILSAIDVLLCSFTAGIALFLMGDANARQGRHADSGASLKKDYLIVELLGAAIADSRFHLAFSLIETEYRPPWQPVPDQSLGIEPNSAAGCTAKNNGALKITECNARDAKDWIAAVQVTQAVTVRMTTIVGPESHFCLVNLAPGLPLRVYGERPELRATPPAHGASAQDVNPPRFHCGVQVGH